MKKLRRRKPVRPKLWPILRLVPDVASKLLEEWGKSLTASEAVPDNHDKNSSEEKLNIRDLVFYLSSVQVI